MSAFRVSKSQDSYQQTWSGSIQGVGVNVYLSGQHVCFMWFAVRHVLVQHSVYSASTDTLMGWHTVSGSTVGSSACTSLKLELSGIEHEHRTFAGSL